jgi:hypothetical protein
MTHKSLLTASAVATLLAISSGAEAADCRRGDRTEAWMSTAVQRTDRMFQRTDRMFQRTGDRMFGWLQRRTRT